MGRMTRARANLMKILMMYEDGYSIEDIADELNVSESFIQTMVDSVSLKKDESQQ